jgi:BASS family bile acid:Na+ symporter
MILSIGMSTRNLGAAIAPVLAMDTVDERSIIMIGLGLPAMLLFAWMATIWFGRKSQLPTSNA